MIPAEPSLHFLIVLIAKATSVSHDVSKSTMTGVSFDNLLISEAIMMTILLHISIFFCISQTGLNEAVQGMPITFEIGRLPSHQYAENRLMAETG